MATIVDALVVTLGLDLTAFKRGKAEAAQATKKLTTEELAAAKQIEERNKIAGESFKRVRTELLALVAVFTAGAGIKAFTESTINGAVNLGYMSQNLQMSTRDLSAWQRAAERAGGSSEGITNALLASQNDAAKLKFGQVSDGVQWFLRMGGNVNDLRDGNTYLLARARIISNMFKVDPGRARFVAQQMGIGDGEFNFLKQGEGAVLALVDAQKKNSAITEQQAASALKLKNEWLDLRDRLTYVGTTVLLELMPTFDRWLDQLQKMADWVAEHKSDIQNWVRGTADEVERFMKLANGAAEAVGGWKNVLLGLLGLKILTFLAPLIRLGLALSSVGTGLNAVSAAGPAALGVLSRVLGVAALLFHSQGLNENEMRTTQPGDVWPGGDGSAKIGDSQQAKDMVSWFMQKGWNKDQASGIVANLWAESKLSPSAVGDNGDAYGIAQWHSDRQANFKKLFGIDIQKSSLEQQLQFVDYEMRLGNEQSAGKQLMAAASAVDAGGIVSRAYERPKDPREEYKRSQYAEDLSDAIGRATAAQIAQQTTAATQPAPSAGSTSTSTSSSETHFNGPINVQTQATDAGGIARDLKSQLQYHFTVAQSNTGMS